MGCCKCKLRRVNQDSGGKEVAEIDGTEDGKQEKRPSARNVPQNLEEEVAKLRTLVSPEELSGLSGGTFMRMSLEKEFHKLNTLIDSKPVHILVLNLSGEMLAELDVSVIETVAEVERRTMKVAKIDQQQFTIILTYTDGILSKTQRLFDVGWMPSQSFQVTAITQAKPPRSPELDRALFMEAWRGGGDLERVQKLLDKNADPNGYTFSDGDQALHVAAGRGYCEVVRALLDANAAIDVPGVGMMTPLQRCSQRTTNYWKGCYPDVQTLIKNHAKNQASP